MIPNEEFEIQATGLLYITGLSMHGEMFGKFLDN